MSASEYRNLITEKLGAISDLEFLSWLEEVVDSYRNNEIIELTAAQSKRVESGRVQRDNGTLTSSENFHQEIEEWFATR